MMAFLEINNLHVEAGGREILKGVSLSVDKGETCILFGPNGSGKSTLLSAIMGYSTTKVTDGHILYNGRDITGLTVDERARMGIGMMMQRPPDVTGVKLGALVNETLKNGHGIECDASLFNMEGFLKRDVNVGFSGGEIKRSELLQLLAQSPNFVMLDEPESGVDLQSIGLIGNKIHELINGKKDEKKGVSALVITHTGQIMDYIHADKAYVLMEGKVHSTGKPEDILRGIKANGYTEVSK